MARRNSGTWLLAGLLAGAALVVAILAAFRSFVGRLDQPAPPLPDRVDVIVALSGGSGRLDEGIRLLQERRAPLLYLVGFQPKAVEPRLAALPAVARLAREGRVVVEPRSESTLEDALHARALVTSRGARSVLLITSVYHVHRADLTFRTILPASVDLHVWPVRSGAFRTDPWYRDGSSRRVVVTEFLKYLLYRVRLAVHVPRSEAAGEPAAPAAR